jgi:hypothetical protein
MGIQSADSISSNPHLRRWIGLGTFRRRSVSLPTESDVPHAQEQRRGPRTRVGRRGSIQRGPLVAEKRQTDAYIPVAEGSEQPGEPITQGRGPAPSWVSVVGKLQPGVAIEQARAEMTLIHDRLSQQFPSPTRGRRLTVSPLAEKIVGEARRALLILLAAAGFVLLIAAANVGNLLLARNSKRQREVAVRSAMGASQARVARQIVTECLVLAAFGGAAGLALAHWTLGLVIRLGAGAVPRLAETQIDVRVIAFASGASLLAALLFSLAAVLSCNGPLLEGLKGDSRASSDGVGTQHFRKPDDGRSPSQRHLAVRLKAPRYSCGRGLIGWISQWRHQCVAYSLVSW